MSKTSQILEDVKSGKCSIEDAQVLLAKLKMSEIKKITYKVSPKGAISFYGIRRMPITLYSEELDQILSITKGEEFAQFLAENKENLSTKVKDKSDVV